MLHFELKPSRRGSWNALSQWDKEVEKLFDGFAAQDQLAPACEIIDGADQFVVALDIPGFKKENIEIELKERHLHVSGTREANTWGEKDKVLRQERRFGKFHRAFSLPEGINEQAVSAKFTDGVLEITIPKTEVVTRKISIN